VQRGEEAKIAQEILGHAQIAMMLDTYSQVLPGMQGQAVEAMSDNLLTILGYVPGIVHAVWVIAKY
jgi:integrase